MLHNFLHLIPIKTITIHLFWSHVLLSLPKLTSTFCPRYLQFGKESTLIGKDMSNARILRCRLDLMPRWSIPPGEDQQSHGTTWQNSHHAEVLPDDGRRGQVVLGCPGQEVRINGLFHLLINGVYWGYILLTNLLLTSWDIQVLSLKLTANAPARLRHPKRKRPRLPTIHF